MKLHTFIVPEAVYEELIVDPLNEYSSVTLEKYNKIDA